MSKTTRSRVRRRLSVWSVMVAAAALVSRSAAGEINEGELRFLESPPPGILFHQHKRLRISPESLDTGWIRDHQCYYNLDRVPALEVVFGAGRVRDLKVSRSENIERVWVEGASVQLQNVGARAVLCLESENRALEREAGTGRYVLRSGPYMRRFLDGYFPMRVSIHLEYPAERLNLESLEPFDLPRKAATSPGELRIDALFEGRLNVVARFTGAAAP